MKFKAVQDKVFVKPIEESTVSNGGIVIPGVAAEAPHRGTVVSAGPGVHNDRGDFVPNSVTEGMTVVYPKGAGQEVELDDEKYFLLEEKQILAIMG